MKVIKRDGRLQDFDLNKVHVTVERASDDAEEPMNNSDIDIVVKTIGRRIMKLETENISVQEVRDIVIEELNNLGFKDIARYYEVGKKL